MLPAVSDHLFVKEYLVSLSYLNHKNQQMVMMTATLKRKMGRNVAVLSGILLTLSVCRRDWRALTIRLRQSRCLTELRSQLTRLSYAFEVFLFLFGVV